jgi:alkanesulfonate monooxygenase SsuD/methylene tetrahydromethanopterin reductase-like flavin-dependent oxidoreductase (luciferase family)
MRFSVWPSPERETAEILDLARWADTNGWFGMWFADHYMPNTEDATTADGDVQEAWAVLPAIAAVTEHIRMGPLVSPTTVHHPAILANRSATIDRISNGRFVLGIGAGWQVNEHQAYGIDLPAAGPRVDRFEEAIQVVRSLLTEPRTTFAGQHFHVVDAPCQPTPVQARLPILVGTGSPRMSKITARHADEWNTWGDVPTARSRATTFAAACEAVDRDPATMWRSVQAMVLFADNDEHAAKLRERAPAERAIVGGASEIIDAIGEYAAMGFDEFIVPDFTFGRDAAARRAGFERFRDEVVSAV